MPSTQLCHTLVKRYEAMVEAFYMEPPYKINDGSFLVDPDNNVDISAVREEKRPSQKKNEKENNNEKEETTQDIRTSFQNSIPV